MISSSQPTLDQLRDHVLLMGGEVESAIDGATRALIERDSELARRVLGDDDRIDALELAADQLCVQLLAQQSNRNLGQNLGQSLGQSPGQNLGQSPGQNLGPGQGLAEQWRPYAAGDGNLRLVVTAIKITPILERIADHACNIARAAVYLNNEPQLKPYVDLPKMSWLACEMLRLSLDAFAASDAVAARAVIDRDDEIDQLYDRVFHDLLDRMANDSQASGRAARLLLVAKHFERIGDYVTDICELIVYMTEALVIKHSR